MNNLLFVSQVRDRVKCISASDGVPISTQWEAQGYHYPTQIAQFGLSHYSKNLTDPEPRRKVNKSNFLVDFFPLLPIQFLEPFSRSLKTLMKINHLGPFPMAVISQKYLHRQSNI